METLKGKNVLLVGATGSIGSAVAKLLSGSGANIFLAGRNMEKLKAMANELQLEEKNTCAFNIAELNDVSGLKEKYFEQFNSIDILINASGIGIIKPLEALAPEEFLKSMQVNVYGPFLLMKNFLPAMKESKKGLVINIPGILGKIPMAGAGAYCASKYALVGLMQSLREEVKRTEIRFTNLFLGGVDSAFWDIIDLRVQRDKMIMVEEAAKSIWFLCQQPLSGVVSEMVIQPFNHQAI